MELPLCEAVMDSDINEWLLRLSSPLDMQLILLSVFVVYT